MKSRSNEEARELTRHFELLLDKAREHRNPRWALEAEARRQVRTASLSAGLPTAPVPDLRRLAKYVGVLQVRETSLAMKGRVIREGGGKVIELERTLHGFEKRFALAHELSHVILDGFVQSRIDAGESDTGRGFRVSYAEMERLCDACAEELLLPLRWVRDRVDPITPSLTTVSELAQLAECPVDFVAIAILRNGLWGAKLFWCTWKNGAPIVSRSYPPEDPASLSSMRVHVTRPVDLMVPSAQKTALKRETTIAVADDTCTRDLEWLPLGGSSALLMTVL